MSTGPLVKTPSHSEPMNSISTDCNELKQAYDACFNNWFQKFLTGSKDMSGCDPFLKVYTECVKGAMEKKGIDVKAFEKDGLDQPIPKPKK